MNFPEKDPSETGDSGDQVHPLDELAAAEVPESTSPLSELLARRDQWAKRKPPVDSQDPSRPDVFALNASQNDPDIEFAEDDTAASAVPPLADGEEASSNPPAKTPRMIAEDSLAPHLESLWSSLEENLRDIHCPLKGDCRIATCPRAFACGALPVQSAWKQKAAIASVLVLGGIVLLQTCLTAFLLVLETMNWQDFLVQFILGPIVGTPLIMTLFCLTWRNRARQRERFQRAALTTAQQMGLRYGFDDLLPATILPIAHAGPWGQAHLAMWGRFEDNRLLVARYETESFGILVAVFPDELEIGDMIMVTKGGSEYEYISQRFAPNHIDLSRLPRYFIAAATPEAVEFLLQEEFISLLNRQSGWQIQVLGGRLFVWQGRWSPRRPDTLPTATPTIAGFIENAMEIRQLIQRA